MSTELATLSRFNQLATKGARQTASALEQLTGQPARAPITDIRLTQRSALERRFCQTEYVGIHAAFSGHVDGTALIALRETDAERVAAEIGADGALHDSGLETVGNIATSGYVDTIANAAGSAITLEPPVVVSEGDPLIPPAGGDGDWLLTITSSFELLDRVLDLDVIVLPDSGSIVQTDEPTAQPPAVDRLVSIGELTSEGAANAAGHLGMMTGLPATVSISRVRFAPIEAAVGAAEQRTAVGTVFELRETPHGFFALLIDEDAAVRVADAMVPDGLDERPDWTGMGKSAISELGNVVTSGFIDGWADAMGGTLAHSPPSFVADDRRAIVSSLVSQLPGAGASSVIVDAEIELDGGRVGCSLHTLPTRDGLESALDHVATTPEHG